jgi:hypothetical protein
MAGYTGPNLAGVPAGTIAAATQATWGFYWWTTEVYSAHGGTSPPNDHLDTSVLYNGLPTIRLDYSPTGAQRELDMNWMSISPGCRVIMYSMVQTDNSTEGRSNTDKAWGARSGIDLMDSNGYNLGAGQTPYKNVVEVSIDGIGSSGSANVPQNLMPAYGGGTTGMASGPNAFSSNQHALPWGNPTWTPQLFDFIVPSGFNTSIIAAWLSATSYTDQGHAWFAPLYFYILQPNDPAFNQPTSYFIGGTQPPPSGGGTISRASAYASGAARGTSTGISIAVTALATPTNGNTLIAVVGNVSGSNPAANVTSINQSGVAWSKIIGNLDAYWNIEVWMGQVTSSSAAKAITINLSAASLGAVANIIEYVGALAVDQTKVNSGDSANPSTGTTNSTTQPNELVIGGIVIQFETLSSPSEGTLLDGALYNSETTVGYIEYFPASTGAQGISVVASGSYYWAGCIATLYSTTPITPIQTNIVNWAITPVTGNLPFTISFSGYLSESSSAPDTSTIVNGETIQIQLMGPGGSTWVNTGITETTGSGSLGTGYFSGTWKLSEPGIYPGAWQFRAYYSGNVSKNMFGCDSKTKKRDLRKVNALLW